MWFAAAAVAEYIYSCNKRNELAVQASFFFVSQIISKEPELCVDNEGSRNTLSWLTRAFYMKQSFCKYGG
jgi:hypothetical protein